MLILMENSIYSRRAKVSYLKAIYLKEIDTWRAETLKSKDHKVVSLRKQLMQLSDIPMELFERIMLHANMLHSLVFFQWRIHFYTEREMDPEARDKAIDRCRMVFASRLYRFRKMIEDVSQTKVEDET